MKTENNNLLTSLSKGETKRITEIERETNAFDIDHKKHFSAAELWNIQRQRKGIAHRSYYVG
jgi:hypothetical protein